MSDLFSEHSQKHLIKKDHQLIECVSTGLSSGDLSKAALICHPHPLFQGSMNNKVVSALHWAYQAAGYATLRFNFRGVGGSTGAHADGDGELEDALYLISWLQQQLPHARLACAGFSFGAFIAAGVANQSHDITSCVSIAPAVHHQDYNTLQQIQCPWLIGVAEQDEVVPGEQTTIWLEQSTQSFDSHVFLGASHFFHGQLIELRRFVKCWLEQLTL